MKRIISCLLSALLLTGCTDIRTRISPDTLALNTGQPVRAAMHNAQTDTVIAAEADHPLLFREALERAAGAEISGGHLSLLLLSGNPANVLGSLLQSQQLAPTCKLLYVPEDACGLLAAGDAPSAAQLDTAVESGHLPVRTADLVYGDLCGGSGVSALPAWDHGRFTLALFDADGVSGMLSPAACRGLALLENRQDSFTFDADSAPCTVTSTALRLTAESSGDSLCFTVSGTLYADTAHPAAAELLLTEMLRAALTETALAAGADLLFLRETALRDGVSAAKHCTQAEWRNLLKAAACRIDIRVAI